MSWDLFVADIPKEFRSTSDVPKGWRPPTIATANELITRIRAAFPHCDFKCPDHGEILGAEYSIELALVPSDELIEGFMLFVRGGASAPYAVARLLNAIGCRAFDTGAADGTIFPGTDIAAGWRNWREFRDRALGGTP